jgi:cell division protein FtsL
MAVPARQLPRPRRPVPAPRRPRVVGLRQPETTPTPRRGGVPFLVVSAAVVGAMVMGLVSMQALVAQRSFDVRDLERRAAELSTDHVQLRRELAELSNPGRIEAAARRAGLVPQQQAQVLEVPAAAAPGPPRALASAGGPGAMKAALGAGG